jgi:hypothetical protein
MAAKAALDSIVDKVLAPVVEGSALVNKTNADWYIAAAFALAFPVARFILDRYVFDVSRADQYSQRRQWQCMPMQQEGQPK